ncbi:hypothetical protein AVEN_92829-1 [Araneus ventricosus]|uniref:Secreted protein n=1 Tax=Araneus ventricosus TaxID=182803 RepID=A0A4Y2IXU5_ARAVE|nr:hypothetical protein AVEN_92829-1 [Araneus ventricosus]
MHAQSINAWMPLKMMAVASLSPTLCPSHLFYSPAPRITTDVRMPPSSRITWECFITLSRQEWHFMLGRHRLEGFIRENQTVVASAGAEGTMFGR